LDPRKIEREEKAAPTQKRKEGYSNAEPVQDFKNLQMGIWGGEKKKTLVYIKERFY